VKILPPNFSFFRLCLKNRFMIEAVFKIRKFKISGRRSFFYAEELLHPPGKFCTPGSLSRLVVFCPACLRRIFMQKTPVAGLLWRCSHRLGIKPLRHE
jgi:hypothetical protein